MGMQISRRTAMRRAISVAAGAAAATTTIKVAEAVGARRPLPFYKGPAASIHADRRTPPRNAYVNVVWSVSTLKREIALTFDDGPKTQWTPKVLDTLRRHGVPATFFVVGRNLVEFGDLFARDADSHEFGNHTWQHEDLARQDFDGAIETLARTHEAIIRTLGRVPTLMRPPYGHLGGSTMLACAELGYSVVLWSRQMLESEFGDNPSGLVDYIVGSSGSGDIVLAHDTGPKDRLVALDQLDSMIAGIRARGLKFVTVSQLLGPAGA
ncbi:MAG TPA: polysaccharide deacetylase family protein [Candidatus Limnocylindrales bacterium]|nr:polysaccharide deacetylase family protein [Candidatus Limnocylindrales bacterium]